MLNTITELVSKIGQFLTTLGKLIVSTINSLISLVINLVNWVTYISNLVIQYLPTELLIFTGLIITISVILMFIGRK